MPVKLGLDHGINNDTDIISEAYRYLALLIIRIWSYQDYNYTYSNPLTVPQADYDNADINEKRIFILKRLKKYAIEWLDSDVFKYIRFNNIPKIDDVKKILDDCANECKKMNQEIDGREGYDEQKLKRITDEATRVNYENYITIPSQTDLPLRNLYALINLYKHAIVLKGGSYKKEDLWSVEELEIF